MHFDFSFDYHDRWLHFQFFWFRQFRKYWLSVKRMSKECQILNVADAVNLRCAFVRVIEYLFPLHTEAYHTKITEIPERKYYQ